MQKNRLTAGGFGCKEKKTICLIQSLLIDNVSRWRYNGLYQPKGEYMSMAIASITIKTDDHIKAQAVEVLSNLGMDMTTGINVFLRKLVQERGFPFAVTLEPDEEYKAYMRAELAKSMERRNDPNRKLYSHDEVWAIMEAKWGDK
jgi:addiction module RelB/DinJ family antitoxin